MKEMNEIRELNKNKIFGRFCYILFNNTVVYIIMWYTIDI